MPFDSQEITTVSASTTSSNTKIKDKVVSDANGSVPGQKYGNKLRIHTTADVYLKLTSDPSLAITTSTNGIMFFPSGIVDVIDRKGASHVAAITSTGSATVKLETGYGS